MKWLFKHQDFQKFGLKFEYFQPLEDVVENLNKLEDKG